MEKKSYFAVIPANVRYDKNLKLLSRMLYGEITALCNEKGFCWANNRYFAELYDVSIQTISSSISQLKENGYITIDFLYKENTKEIDRRIIKIFNTPSKKFEYPIKENLNTPLKENLKDNNTIMNSTMNNIYKGKDFFEEKYKKEFQEFLESDSRRNNKSFNSDN